MRTTMFKAAFRSALCLILGLAAAPLAAQDNVWRPTLNFYGATGLIDMPSGEAQPDGAFTYTLGYFGGISRQTLTFQITPRLSGSFRFLGIGKWNDRFCPPDCDDLNQFDIYYDRSFDLRYQVFTEGYLRPAVTVGLQDFAGTGVLSGEYVVATKTIARNVKVSAGLGWGRLGSYKPIGSPFGERPRIDVGFGGNFNPDTWFRGPAAPFGGIEWKVNDRWTAKLEYSSDAYDEESRRRRVFDHKSPLNFGIEYAPSPLFQVGAYYLYGSEIGISGRILLDPKSRPTGGVAGGAPLPVAVRPAGAAGWTPGTVTDDRTRAEGEALVKLLEPDGLRVEGYSSDGRTAELRIRNPRIDAGPEAIGRSARALSRVAPPSVETFRIIPIVDGLPASAVTIRRADLERLEFEVDNAPLIRERAVIAPADFNIDPGAFRDPTLYPKLNWTLGPYNRLRVFDQNGPFKIDVGVRATLRYDLAPGLTFDASFAQQVAGNLDDRPPLPVRGNLQPVRSAIYNYDRDGKSAIEKLQLSYKRKIGRDLYGRVSVGYFERMFGGISTEVLWLPVGSRLAIGGELNYVAQRAPDGGFSFDLPQSLYQDDGPPRTGPSRYDVLTGHISAYYQLPKGYNVQLDVGRYLAGDIGATLTIDREFANGWRIGAFATKTNVSAEDFGSGSFDKGIRIEMPFAWVLGKPSRRTTTVTLRPFGRDGGARLNLDGRLYEDLRDYQEPQMDLRWGRFWR